MARLSYYARLTSGASAVIRAFRTLLYVALLVTALPALAQTAHQRLDGVRATVEQVEQALKRAELSDAALVELRARVEPLTKVLEEVMGELTPRHDSLRARIDQLGAKPADKSAESPQVASEREDLQKQFDEVDTVLKRARVLEVQLDQVSDSILSRRRDLFTRALFARSTSVISPGLWLGVARELPSDIAAFGYLASDWWAAVSRLSGARLFTFAGGTIAIILLLGFVTQMQRRVVRRDPDNHNPDDFKKAAGALWVAASTAATPIVAAFALIGLWRGLDLFPMRLEPVVGAVSDGVVRIAIAVGVARGLLAPGLINWRMLDLRDVTVERLTRLVFVIALTVSGFKCVEAVIEVIGASLPVSVAFRGLFALLIALGLAYGLRGIAIQSDSEDECLGPRVTVERDLYGPIRLAVWAAIVVIIASTLIGYVAFAAFLVDQIVWLSFVGSALFLLMTFAREGIGSSLHPNAAAGRAILTSVGLHRDALDQVAIILTGLAQLSLILAAVMAAAAPWGIESNDMFSSIRAAFFGFRVGEVTISISSIIIAIFIFTIGFALTRGFQRWLDSTYLPHTQLDTGLRNSIRTSIGYVGFVIAAAVGLSYVGLSLDKLAIVAGALSVGIGFGLQSIVNNFVSGLILLWERAIRVGDWVVVGNEQGYVKRINVRSTEIETFDRATMIVPNSNLVSGVVKNWVRTDKVGRIKIPISVNINADPDKVRETLLDCARNHELVQKIPAPNVLFISIADNLLCFELVCFVADVETSGRLKSDLHFEIFRRFKEAGFDLLHHTPPLVAVAGLDRLEAILDRAATPKS